MKIKNTILILTVMLMAAFGACDSDGDDATLEGRTWKLTEFGVSGSTSLAVGNATIVFDGESGEATGSTGCNSFFGDYTVGGDSVSLSGIGATERACIDPPGVMQQESAFLGILAAVTRFELDDDELKLVAGNEELAFKAE